MTPTKVIRRLISIVEAEADQIRQECRWDPSCGRGACVPMTRIGCDVLGEFGIGAEPLSVSVTVANAPWWAWETGEPPEEAHGHYSTGLIGQPTDAEEYPYHVVVHVPAREEILDLDLGSWMCGDCRDKGIVLPKAAALQWPTDATEQQWPFPGGSQVEMSVYPNATQFLENDYWTKPPLGTVKRLVRAIRKGKVGGFPRRPEG